MTNPGNPAPLVPAEQGNTRALKHAAYSPRMRDPRAQEIAERVMQAPWASDVDELGALEIGMLNDLLDHRAKVRRQAEANWPMRYEAELPDEVVEAIAERAAQKVAARIGETSKEPSTYLTVEEAASLLRCSRQRVHDLLSARKLRRFKDGGRTLVLRGEL